MEQRVCVLLAPGYEEVEALTPVDYLRRAGATVDIISTISEITVPSAHQVLVQADSFLDDIRPEDYAMVVVPGGLPGVPNLIANEKVLAFVKAMADQGAWVTSLCAGPSVLRSRRCARRKCTTCFPGWEGKLENIGSFSEDTRRHRRPRSSPPAAPVQLAILPSLSWKRSLMPIRPTK